MSDKPETLYKVRYQCHHCENKWSEVHNVSSPSECPVCFVEDVQPSSIVELGERPMKKDQFIENVFEIAFGDNAINRGYTRKEVVEKVKEYSDKAHKLDDQSMRMKRLIENQGKGL